MRGNLRVSIMKGRKERMSMIKESPAVSSYAPSLIQQSDSFDTVSDHISCTYIYIYIHMYFYENMCIHIDIYIYMDEYSYTI